MARGDDAHPRSDAAAPTFTFGRLSVRSVLLLVACCAAFLWAIRYANRHRDPVAAESRALQRLAISRLQQRDAAERLAAIDELARLLLVDDLSAIMALAESLDDPDARVRAAAGRAFAPAASAVLPSMASAPILRRAGLELVRHLNDPDPSVRAACADSLYTLAAPLSDFEQSPPVAPELAIEQLSPLVSDDVPAVRLAAIWSIANLASPRTAIPPPALLVGLEDPSPEIREAAVRSLSMFRSGAAAWAGPLLRQLADEPNTRVQSAALHSLAELPQSLPHLAPTVVPVLPPLIRDTSRSTRVAIVLWSARLGPAGADLVPQLIETLRSLLGPGPTNAISDPASQVVYALGCIAPGTSKAPDALATLAETAHSGPPPLRASCVLAIAEFGPAALPALRSLANDSDPSVRDVATSSLRSIESAWPGERPPPAPNR